MSTPPGSFRPDELVGGDAKIPDSERAESYAAARELEQAISGGDVHPSAGFSNRVMAAVMAEPAPRAIGFLAPLQARHSLAGVVASVKAAWSVVMGGGGRPVGARGLALAYVLAVMLVGVSLTGVAAFGTGAALHLITPDHTPQPSIHTPGPTSSPDESMDGNEASDSHEPEDSGEPGESPGSSESSEPGESDHPEDSSGPGASPSPEASDDHGGSSSEPSASDDDGGGSSNSPEASDDPSGSGGSGSGSASQSPKPSETPKSSD